MKSLIKHKNLIGSLALAGLITASGSQVSAAPLGPLDIDFRTVDWSGANYQPLFQVGDIEATAFPGGAGLYQDSDDGLGIRGGEVDEIDADELLTLTFDSGLNLWGFGITDLFKSGDGAGDQAGEHGRASLYDTSGIFITSYDFFGVNSDQGNGEQYIGFQTPLINVGRIEFTAIAWEGSTRNNEFSVAGLNTASPVPEPATLFLFGTGLAGLAGTQLRRKK